MRSALHFDRVAAGGITLPFLRAAPFFGALAAVLLLVAGSHVLLSRWHPALIGALHIYTIGFLLFSMAGTLLQIGPVVSARPALQNEHLARTLRIALGAGAMLYGAVRRGFSSTAAPGVQAPRNSPTRLPCVLIAQGWQKCPALPASAAALNHW